MWHLEIIQEWIETGAVGIKRQTRSDMQIQEQGGQILSRSVSFPEVGVKSNKTAQSYVFSKYL